ncbi:TPA: YjbF family lipoprotein [Stenotrophomonas maltophilia]|uniref:YjbF family lipoprotein n=2 Tax=Stenotrophomonas TaxID=40323 RepID=UPI00201D1717|nr:MULTISPECIES: YjbF family lipoprotein [Stenotrophomonas]MDH1485299.1 YjbF family lipoprotein [Stenotrophomonas sp. GD03712]UQY97030.1 YjbF family lipoprotein [Stenotrophomonas maltophilia]
MSRNARSGLMLRSFRLGLLAAIAVSAAGCGVVSRSSVKAVQLAVQGAPDVQPTAQDVARNRYPQIKVNGPAGGAVLVLGAVDDGRQAWYSSERSIVFLRNGLIEATHGGAPELQQMQIIGPNPFLDLRKVHEGQVVQRRYDLMPGYRFGIEVTGTLYPLGTERVDILGRTLELLHIREQLRGEGWKQDNHFWVDPANGFIWKSRQAIAPDTHLDIIQLKPYSPDLQPR